MTRRKLMLALSTAFAGVVRAASDPLYDEKADATKDISAAIATASRSSNPRKNIALVFGANWCFDCRMLEAQMHRSDLAPLIERSYAVVKIDVGRMDKNIDVASKYDVPIKNGIPAVAILDARGKLLFAQDQGQFADARHMSYESIKAFFEQWKPKG